MTTVQVVAGGVIWLGLIAFFVFNLFSRDVRGGWTHRLAQAVLFTAIVPCVFWVVVLPRSVARWYLILLIPSVVLLGAYLHRVR